MSKNCYHCGKIRRPVFLGNTVQYYTPCGCDEIPSLDDIFDTKSLKMMTMNNNNLEDDIVNPSSAADALFGEEAQLHHNDHELLGGPLNVNGLLGNEMSDVWLSVEQSFENDINAMLPDTDDNFNPDHGFTINELIDSAASLHELSQTIKTEPLDFDDSSNDLELEIKVEVDDKFEYSQALERTLNFPLNGGNRGSAVSANRTLLGVKEEPDKKHFSCQQCGAKYSTLPDLKCHKMLCYGSNASDSSRPYKCEKCGCSYTRKYHLDTHKDRYHSNTSYSCGKCLKIYRAREDYLRHLRKNSCTASRSKASKTSQELIMNSQRLHNVHRFPCRHCPKRFFRRHYLERHIEEKHHKDWSEQESCEICSPTSSRNVSNASSPSTDMTVTPAESDVSSDDSGLVVDELGFNAVKKPVGPLIVRKAEVTPNMLINVIGHSGELRGNGLYSKPDNSLYQCVMCNFTTKYIGQLSQHLEKHQAVSTNTTTSCANKNYIVSV